MVPPVEETLRALLAEDPNLDAEHIEVSFTGGRVTLRGRVRTQRERDEAEAIARGVEGVAEVENRLVVLGEPI